MPSKSWRCIRWQRRTINMSIIFLSIAVFAITIAVMSLLWLMLDYDTNKKQRKLKTIAKIVKETNMNREQAEKLYDLFMD